MAGKAVDFGYLEDFMAGDRAVVREVLGLFLQQAETWRPDLEPGSAGWRDVIHTIKGSARGVGAIALGDACAEAEAEGDGALRAVRAALEAALSDINDYLRR